MVLTSLDGGVGIEVARQVVGGANGEGAVDLALHLATGKSRLVWLLNV